MVSAFPKYHFSWTVPNKFLFHNKIEEIHFKNIHRYYPCNKYLSKFYSNISPLCSFCQEEEESILHLFYLCSYTKQFWLQISASIFLAFHQLCNISVSKVIFHSDVSENKKLDDILNFFCMMGKYHIQKARYLKFKPSCKIFAYDLVIIVFTSKNPLQ